MTFSTLMPSTPFVDVSLCSSFDDYGFILPLQKDTCVYIYVEKERKERTKAREYRRSLATLTIILSNRKCVSSHTLNEYENELTTMRKMREKYEE